MDVEVFPLMNGYPHPPFPTPTAPEFTIESFPKLPAPVLPGMKFFFDYFSFPLPLTVPVPTLSLQHRL